MRELESLLGMLRPFVGENGWDYLVVWKLGDYSTRLRFIEMMGCCCGGAKEMRVHVEDNLLQLCKDTAFPHPKRSKACEALASLPPSVPLSFGIHVEVLVSGQPRWISPDESDGTRVFIPILGGLIELSAAKQIPMDYQMIELIIACVETDLKDHLPHSDYESLSTGSVSLMEPLSFESSLSYEPERVRGSDCSQQKTSPLVDYLRPMQFEFSNTTMRLNEVVSDSGRNKKDYLNGLCKRDRLSQKSRNLLVERNRRNKLKAKILSLRSLVPTITKMDIQSTLGDACSYITELRTKVKALQDELKVLEDEDATENVKLENQNITSEINVDNYESCSISTGHCNLRSHDALTVNDIGHQVEEKVEVNEYGRNKFYLKLILERKRCWFPRLMEGVNGLGLDVIDASVVTIEDTVMNIFKAEAKIDELQADQLKASLIKLLRKISADVPDGAI